jgi:hypothetical protein
MNGGAFLLFLEELNRSIWTAIYTILILGIITEIKGAKK